MLLDAMNIDRDPNKRCGWILIETKINDVGRAAKKNHYITYLFFSFFFFFILIKNIYKWFNFNKFDFKINL
jgi:hypothetical protein